MFVTLIAISLIIFLKNGVYAFDSEDDDFQFSLLLNGQFDDFTDAFLIINSTNYKRLVLSLQNLECINCKFLDVANVTYGRNISIRLSTAYPSYNLVVKQFESNEVYCQWTNSITFGERSVYRLTIDNKNICDLSMLSDNGFVYWPIIIAILILIAIALVYIIFRLVYHKYHQSRYISVTQTNTECDITITETNNSNVETNDAVNVHKRVCCTKINSTAELVKEHDKHSMQSHRLRFIDTFRGICLCLMIFVNYGAGGYVVLEHTVWNGLHLADLLFPSFIFIMGVSISISLHNIVHNSISERNSNGKLNKNLIKNLLFKIIRRSLLLFFFGLLTSNNATVSLREIRVMGILQRFSISYFICALLELIYLIINDFTYHDVICFDTAYRRPLKIIQQNLKEILLYKLQWIAVLLLTLVWILITFLLPVPGCPKGYLGPGGLHDNGLYENCTGGAAGYIDRIILGQSHLYQWLTYRSVYQAKLAFDSEGLLGCLTSCVLTYIGISAGHIIIHYKEPIKRVLRFIIYSVLYGLIALILCKWSRDDGWIPINKNLWSLSFILAIASICFLILTILYLLTDRWKVFSGKPFIFPGRNSICIYICHIVFSNFFPVQFHVLNSHTYLTIMHFYGVILWCSVAWFMDHKKLFIKL